MRALIAEDNAAICDCLYAALREGGHVVNYVRDGRQADAAMRDPSYDLLVLDLGLPSMDGCSVLQHLRQRGNDLSVLVVTARDSLDERVRVLDFGADDYLVKPFALTEFTARVRAVLRRRASRGIPVMTMGRLRLDLPGRRAWTDANALELTAREFGLLEALAARADRIVSRTQLVEALCGWDQDLTDNGLDISIHRLRHKLEHSGARIRTVRGLGYMLEAEGDTPA